MPEEDILQPGEDGEAPEEIGNVYSSGTSVFDPVLCEIVYRWFAPPEAKILDPFAGGSVRGIVASKLGLDYTGIELREEQVKANRQQARSICRANKPKWILGDAKQALSIARGSYDLIFSCPPYGDLERYSNDPADLSTMEFPEFMESLGEVIRQCCGMLKENRFAAFVVGDFRDEQGFFRKFPQKTTAAFEAAGAFLYNDAILVTAVGSLAMRIGPQFCKFRKLGKTHQQLLVFFKGDPKKIPEEFGILEQIDYLDFEESEEFNEAEEGTD